MSHPLSPPSAPSDASSLDLSGTWEFRLDPKDEGIDQRWFAQPWTAPEHLQLPGSLQAQGFGEEPTLESEWVGSIIDKRFFTEPEYGPYRQPGNIKYPCWLQPGHLYQGAAWYRRTFVLPEGWSGTSWDLSLERCHWTSRLWVNGEEAGFRESLSVPHVYRLPEDLSGEVELTLCVDNRMWIDLGPNSHSMSDHTQTNWNGIIGAIEAKPVPDSQISSLELHPDSSRKSVRLTGTFSSRQEQETLDLVISAKKEIITRTQVTVTNGQPLQTELELGSGALLWSPQHPALYDLTITSAQGSVLARETFGLVQTGIQGTQFTLNGQPLFLRGALDCAIFPLTGYPPMQVEAWREIFETCRAYGLNHIRFHSWCPPKAAFLAGDQTGMLFQVECPTWANTTVSIGDGKPIDEWLYVEAERILEAYGNHACFRFMAYGNEPAGPGKDGDEEYPGLQHGASYLGPWCSYWREKDPRRFHAAAAGWPRVRESDFHNVPDPRVQRWGEGLESVINGAPPCSNYTYTDRVAQDKPTVSHEIGQWCAFPDLEEVHEYTGHIKAKNFEIFADFLEKAGLRHQAHDFLKASGHLQTFCYKADIEAALRTPGFAGFQLLGLQDFPGQGTALVGVLNAFWKSKGYCEADNFSQWCGDIVLLAEFEKHLYVEGEAIDVPVLLTNFSSESLTGEQVHWRLQEKSGALHASGTLYIGVEDPSGRTPLGTVTCSFPGTSAPTGFDFVLSLREETVQNRWSVFRFPQPSSPPPSEILVTSTWTPELEQALTEGHTCWLQLDPGEMDVEIQLGFSSIFWNTAWSRNQPPHTLGILCDPEHPALNDFPASPFSDWQWWGVCRYGKVMNLDRLPPEVTPIIQVVPDWFAPHKLAVAFEVRVGSGCLLVTSIDFTTAPEEDPARAQLARSFHAYLQDPPTPHLTTVTKETLSTLSS